LTTVLARWPAPAAKTVLRIGALRGLMLALVSARYDAVAVIRYDPGWRTLLLTRALLGRRRKLVVLQFFDHEPSEADGVSGRLWRRVDRWALRRALALAQVLTEAELAVYPERFGILADRFRLVRFAARTALAGAPAPVAGPVRRAVVAAGRAHCDWQTLIAAAGGRGWPLTIVCGGEDLARVQELNSLHGAGATVHSDLPAEQVQALLSEAAVSVVCLQEGLVGRGHVRLCNATDAGAAIVASDVGSLSGYVEDGVSALVVAPADPPALRTAVERLLGDTVLRDRIAGQAFERAAAWTAADYVAAIGELAGSVCSGVGLSGL
jgi:glycosyltransferase involved in cell wall biosynthesis